MAEESQTGAAPVPEDSGINLPDAEVVDRSELTESIKRRDAALTRAQVAEKTNQEMKNRLAKFEAAESDAEQKRLENEGKYQEALTKAQENAAVKYDALHARHEELTIREEIRKAATEAHAVEPNDVVLALAQMFSIDPKSLEPVPDEARLKSANLSAKDDGLRAKSIAQIVQDFLEARPHLQAAQSPGGGAGTTTTPGGKEIPYEPGKTPLPEYGTPEWDKEMKRYQRMAEQQAGR